MAVSRLMVRECDCGQLTVIFPEEAADVGRKLAARAGADLVIADGRTVHHCPVCGREVSVPPGEALDSDHDNARGWAE